MYVCGPRLLIPERLVLPYLTLDHMLNKLTISLLLGYKAACGVVLTFRMDLNKFCNIKSTLNCP